MRRAGKNGASRRKSAVAGERVSNSAARLFAFFASFSASSIGRMPFQNHPHRYRFLFTTAAVSASAAAACAFNAAVAAFFAANATSSSNGELEHGLGQVGGRDADDISSALVRTMACMRRWSVFTLPPLLPMPPLMP